MGFALAAQAAAMGADVCLVCGPVNQLTPPGIIRRIDVVSALQMLEVCQKEFETADITIMSAAVADFTPLHPSDRKIKKAAKSTLLQIELKPTTDILAELGSRKKPGQILVGFALETDNEYQKP
jgi:phosphopantothenoylcysteine decarboxylase/phosphopantothenate--cysteine ligase